MLLLYGKRLLGGTVSILELDADCGVTAAPRRAVDALAKFPFRAICVKPRSFKLAIRPVRVVDLRPVRKLRRLRLQQSAVGFCLWCNLLGRGRRFHHNLFFFLSVSVVNRTR